MDQSYSTKRHDGPLERLICLESNNLLQVTVDVPPLVAHDGGYGLLVNIIHTAALAFYVKQLLELSPELFGTLCWTL